jgi:hypothetical protein
MGCLWSIDCLVLSMHVAACLRISGGTIPANGYIYLSGVGLRQPVIILHVSLRAVSTCFVCLDWFHTRQAYSPAEKQSANPVVRIVFGVAPHLLPASFHIRLFLASTFILVFLHCSLNVRVLSSVTPR